jgi:UDP-N-acetyl-D-glucosamine dehydrogenase
MNICVVGLGYVGLPLAIQAAKAGFKTYGYDLDAKKVSDLTNGKVPKSKNDQIIISKLQSKGNLEFISKLDSDLEISIYIIAVPTPLNSHGEPDLSMLKNACETIARIIKPDSLIINESTSFIGTLRDFIKPLVESNSVSKGLKYGVAPERIDPGNSSWTLINTPRVISGLTHEAIDETRNFYQKFCNEVHQVESPEIAEAAKLIENSFRQVNIALVNELSGIASKLNFSIHDALKAASTKPFGFMPFYPSIGVGGHCIPVDPAYLSYSAKKVGSETKLIDLSKEINLSMAENISTRIEEWTGQTLPNKVIQVAGISYKIDIPDMREAPAIELIRLLRLRGAKVSWCDPVVGKFDGEISTPLSKEIDLGLIITPHSSIDFSFWKNHNIEVLDLSANTKNYGWVKFL